MPLGKHSVTAYLEWEGLEHKRYFADIELTEELFHGYLAQLEAPLHYHTKEVSSQFHASTLISVQSDDECLEGARALAQRTRDLEAEKSGDYAREAGGIADWTEFYEKVAVECDIVYTETGFRPNVLYLFTIERA